MEITLEGVLKSRLPFNWFLEGTVVELPVPHEKEAGGTSNGNYCKKLQASSCPQAIDESRCIFFYEYGRCNDATNGTEANLKRRADTSL